VTSGSSFARVSEDKAPQGVESGILPNGTAPFTDTYATGKTCKYHPLKRMVLYRKVRPTRFAWATAEASFLG
jgi:hypothetical protein